jgi:competence protein ComEC
MYPALRVGLLYAAGILLARSPGEEGAPVLVPFVALTLLVLVFLLALLVRRHSTPVISLVGAGLCVTLGAGRMALVEINEEAVPEGGLDSLVLIGTIVDPPVNEPRRVRFLLEPEEQAEGRASLHGLVAVALSRRTRDPPLPDLDYGMRVLLRGALRIPPGERNPGEFNLREYYRANGIGYVMKVRGVSNLHLIDGVHGSPLYRELVIPVRTFILRQIDRTIGGEEGEYLKGIFIGVRSGISRETREAFVNAGVAHILAVSGSNVAVIAATLYVLLGALRIPRRLIEPVVAAGLLYYMLLTGSQPPVVRATIMALVYLVSRLIERRVNTLNSLGLAGLIILLIDPRQLFDVGFQLSFGAVLSILLLYPKANRLLSGLPLKGWPGRGLLWCLRLSALSLVASLGTLPLAASYFEKVSIIGLLANIVVVPAAGASVVLGIVAAMAETVSTPVGEAYAAVNWLLLHATLRLTVACGTSPVAFLQTSGWGPLDTIPYLAAVAFVATLDSPVGRRRMLIILLLALHLRVLAPEGGLQSSGDVLRVAVLDVGQGDAILVQMPGGKTMLIDTGPKILDYDAGERVVAPALRRMGVTRINLLVLTHPHNDHIGGAGYLCSEFAVERIIHGGALPKEGMIRGVGLVSSPLAGTMLTPAPRTRLYILSPGFRRFRPPGRRAMHRGNNSSIVLKLQFGTTSFLFTGDMEQPPEERMTRVYGEFLRSSVLKVAHHGGDTGTGARFLRQVRPEFAVISVGTWNAFHHPSSPLLTRLHGTGAVVARTDREGAVIFESDGRRVERRFWR